MPAFVKAIVNCVRGGSSQLEFSKPKKAKENEGSKTTGAVVARDAAGGTRGGARRAARAGARTGRPDQVVWLTRPSATECATKRSGTGGLPYPARRPQHGSPSDLCRGPTAR